jgi:Protein of unknown function VcgC/VcgE (DUF2780)
MNKMLMIAAAMTITVQAQAGWLDSASDLLNSASNAVDTASDVVEAANTSETQVAQATNTDMVSTAKELLPAITQNLGVTDQQASGGLGSLFQLAQTTLSEGDFTSISDAVPNMQDLLSAAPEVTGEAAEGGSGLVGNLMNTASQYSDTVKTANTVMQQFEALGLDPAMIPQYVQVINNFLQSTSGQQTVDLFAKGVSAVL